MTDKQQRSLSALLEQRKHQHRLPDSVRNNVQRAIRKPNKRIWTTALPAAMASLLVVIVIWPVQESDVLKIMSTQREPDYLSQIMSEPALTLESTEIYDEAISATESVEDSLAEIPLEEESAFFSGEVERDIAAEMPSASFDAVMKPAQPKAAPEAKRSISSETSEDLMAKESSNASENVAVLFADKDDFIEPRTFYIESASPVLGVSCEGLSLYFPDTLEVVEDQWLLIHWEEDKGWQSSLLDLNPCDSTQ